MLELTKTQTTKDYAEIHIRRIPSHRVDQVRQAIEKIFDLAGMPCQSHEEDNDSLSTLEAVFPDFHVGHALRGLRTREGLTQKRLADMIGARPSHISEMENGKRPIGKEVAKRLAKALRTDYKVFL